MMEVKLKFGIDQLLFGMKQKDVEALYGKPSSQYVDEEDNIVYVYNQQKMRLTFYDEEEMRLGYIIAQHPNLTLFGETFIGKTWEEVKTLLATNKITKLETELVEGTENYFSEENWLFVLMPIMDRFLKLSLALFSKKKTMTLIGSFKDFCYCF
jgi:hypothetical protein